MRRSILSPLYFAASLALLGCGDKDPSASTDDSGAPAAGTEVCDGADDDGDGLIDEGVLSSLYTDADGDGYGDPAAPVEGCAGDAGLVEDSSDCDDADASVNPGAAEDCDGADQDCDATADEGLATETYYADNDGDGYGDDGAAATDCAAPSGHVTAGGDCDDGDDAVHPGAAEICEDGADSDCDGYDQSCRLAGDLALCDDQLLLGGAEGDFAGWKVAGAGDQDGDGRVDLLIGAPDRDGPKGDDEVGAAYVVMAADLSGDDYALEDAATLVGEGGDDESGYSLAGVGDVDGDGIDDLAIGGRGYDSFSGITHLALGPVTGDLALVDSWARLIGASSNEAAGRALEPVGDLNGDGYAELLIGAWSSSAGVTWGGTSYVVYGPVTQGDTSLADADARLLGVDAYGGSGRSLAGAGDVDGDGAGDLLIGGQWTGSNYSGPGHAYLVLGPPTGDVDLSDAAVTLSGQADGDAAGCGVDGGGDLDGDGYDDLVVGACSEGDGGVVYVIAGSRVAGGELGGAVSLADADLALSGESGSGAGRSVSLRGDLDGDGFTDLVVGARFLDGDEPDAGGVYVLHGPLTGSASLADADARLLGVAEDDEAGLSVETPGDVNGDGLDDLLAGAHGYDGAWDDAGAACLIYGGAGL